MAIRIIPPKRVKKAKSRNGQEVLRRLEEYLESESDEPAKLLCRFWEDQQSVITYQELRMAVMAGYLSLETLQLWQQDYSVLVSGRLRGMWENAAAAGPSGQPVLDNVPFKFDTQAPGILNWIDQRGAEFVTASSQEQKDAIAALLTKKMREKHTVDELSRLIRPCIGLTERDAKAVARFYDNIVDTMKKEHPRMKPESIRQKALDASAKYAEKKHRARAMTIARTEGAFAYHWGEYEGIKQAQAEGLLGKVVKKWSTSGDERVCAQCAVLEGTEIEMEADFNIKGRILFQGQHMLPPAHPDCGCGVEYIEAEPPKMPQSEQMYQDNADEGSSEDFGNTEYIGSVNPEKSSEAVGYYGNEIRAMDTEHAVVIDKNGNVYHVEGGRTSVCFKGIDLEGAYIVHNHPNTNGVVSFGEDDFLFMKENNNIAELQAVNNFYTYSAVPLAKIREISYNEIYREALIRGYGAGEDDLQHLAMMVLAEKGGVVYGRTPFK